MSVFYFDQSLQKKLGLYNLSSINTRKFQKIGYFPVKPALHHVYMYVTPKNRNPIATLWWIPALVYKNYSKQSLPLALPFPILRKRKIIKNYKANIRLEIPSMTIGSAILLQPRSHGEMSRKFLLLGQYQEEYHQASLTTIAAKFGSDTTNSHFMLPCGNILVYICHETRHEYQSSSSVKEANEKGLNL